MYVVPLESVTDEYEVEVKVEYDWFDIVNVGKSPRCTWLTGMMVWPIIVSRNQRRNSEG